MMILLPQVMMVFMMMIIIIMMTVMLINNKITMKYWRFIEVGHGQKTNVTRLAFVLPHVKLYLHKSVILVLLM